MVYMSTWYIRVASRVSEPLKTDDLTTLANIMKISKLHRVMAYGPVLSLPPKMKIMSILAKNS